MYSKAFHVSFISSHVIYAVSALGEIHAVYSVCASICGVLVALDFYVTHRHGEAR